VSGYRDEVTQAIEHAASDNRGLLEIVGVDRDGSTEWREDPAEILRTLIELGVRLGLEAALGIIDHAENVYEVQHAEAHIRKLIADPAAVLRMGRS
jgi:hypothetical protein